MPKVALADSLLDWNGLISRADPLAEEGSDLHDLVAKLRAETKRVEDLDNLRTLLQAQRQQATQELNESRWRAKYLASRIRWELKGVYGETNRKLVQFGIKPRRGPRTAPPPQEHPTSALRKRKRPQR